MSDTKEEKFKCDKCGIEIGGHNEYLHDGMCDDCFFDKYFPEEAQVFETDTGKIKRHCRGSPVRRENQKFNEFLKSDKLDQERFQKIVKEITGKIDCTKCANCCKVLKPALDEQDAGRISEHLNLAEEDFISKYAVKNNENEPELKQIPCPFLINNKFQVYEIRPESCKEYPYLLGKDITTRCHSFFSNAEICPIVFNVLENAKEEFLKQPLFSIHISRFFGKQIHRFSFFVFAILLNPLMNFSACFASLRVGLTESMSQVHPFFMKLSNRIEFIFLAFSTNST